MGCFDGYVMGGKRKGVSDINMGMGHLTRQVCKHVSLFCVTLLQYHGHVMWGFAGTEVK